MTIVEHRREYFRIPHSLETLYHCSSIVVLVQTNNPKPKQTPSLTNYVYSIDRQASADQTIK